MLWVGIIFLITLLLFSAGFMLSNINRNNIVAVCIILIMGFTLFLALGIIALNRGGSTITYDRDRNILYRKGYICGYESQVLVDEITEIIIVQLPKEPVSYIFVDLSHTKYDGFSKKSFFKIEKTRKNREFIEQFWDKPIKEYKKYEELFKQK